MNIETEQLPASATTTAAEAQQYRCPKHPAIELTHRLAGGAGHCRACGYFQQSVNHVEPQRDRPRLTEAEARQVKTKAKRKAKAKATTKRKRKSVTKTLSRRRDNLTA